MPMRAPRACRCGKLQPCPDHTRKAWAGRPSARARGYTSAWDKASREMRERGAICVECLREPAVELDHKIPLSQGGSTDPAENGVPLGRRCHDAKTQRERGVGTRRRALTSASCKPQLKVTE